MYKEIRKKAKKRVEDKLGFYVACIVFICAIVVLIALSFYFPFIKFWLRLPIPIIIAVMGILYLNVFGYSRRKRRSADWKEEEIDLEMIKLYRQKLIEVSSQEELAEKEALELKEMEYLEDGQEWNEEFV